MQGVNSGSTKLKTQEKIEEKRNMQEKCVFPQVAIAIGVLISNRRGDFVVATLHTSAATS